jgi:hypothetical protein
MSDQICILSVFSISFSCLYIQIKVFWKLVSLDFIGIWFCISNYFRLFFRFFHLFNRGCELLKLLWDFFIFLRIRWFFYHQRVVFVYTAIS